MSMMGGHKGPYRNERVFEYIREGIYTMLSRRGTRPQGTEPEEDVPSKTSSRRRSTLWSRQSSKIVGAILLGVAAVWFVWLLLHQGVPAGISILPVPGLG